jgi:hypothetical protein
MTEITTDQLDQLKLQLNLFAKKKRRLVDFSDGPVGVAIPGYISGRPWIIRSVMSAEGVLAPIRVYGAKSLSVCGRLEVLDRLLATTMFKVPVVDYLTAGHDLVAFKKAYRCLLSQTAMYAILIADCPGRDGVQQWKSDSVVAAAARFGAGIITEDVAILEIGSVFLADCGGSRRAA